MRWLERMGLADRAKSKLEELSHGNQQRVQLATALVHEPELLVLDEPFCGLDPIGIATMTEVVHERAAAGVGVLFSSHQLDLVEDVCEDVVIIARGRIVAAGPIEDLKAALRPAPPRGRGRGLGRARGSHETARSPSSSATATGSSCSSTRRVDLDGLLAMARAAGDVRRFAYGPPQLSELFMEYVPARTSPTARGGMSRLRSIWLVARREILERAAAAGSSCPSCFTTLFVVGSFVVPAILFGDDEATAIGIVEPAPADSPSRSRHVAATVRPGVVELGRSPIAAAGEAALTAGDVDVLVDVPADLVIGR